MPKTTIAAGALLGLAAAAVLAFFSFSPAPAPEHLTGPVPEIATLAQVSTLADRVGALERREKGKATVEYAEETAQTAARLRTDVDKLLADVSELRALAHPPAGAHAAAAKKITTGAIKK